MLKNARAFNSFSVPDLGAAKEFYGETLDLEVRERPEGLEIDLAGGGRVFIYQSPTNKPAQFTLINFLVDDIEEAVTQLMQKGVAMEHYNIPGTQTDERGISRQQSDGMGPRAMAWFKDPAGNILSVLQEN